MLRNSSSIVRCDCMHKTFLLPLLVHTEIEFTQRFIHNDICFYQHFQPSDVFLYTIKCSKMPIEIMNNERHRISRQQTIVLSTSYGLDYYMIKSCIFYSIFFYLQYLCNTFCPISSHRISNKDFFLQNVLWDTQGLNVSIHVHFHFMDQTVTTYAAVRRPSVIFSLGVNFQVAQV